MKQFKEKHFFKIAILFFILLGSILIENTIYAAQYEEDKKIIKPNNNFKVDLTYGIDGFAIYDQPVPLYITVQSNEEFQGILRVSEIEGYGIQDVAYAERITLAAGEKKTFTFIPYSIAAEGDIYVEILDKKDKVVYKEENIISLDSLGSKSVVGILSDDYPALNYFDGLALNMGNYKGISSVLELSEKTLVPDSMALSTISYIIIDNYDTSKLSDEQYSALKEWVNNGGSLILSLGPNHKKVTNRFSDDFITGTFGKLEKKDLAWEGIIDNNQEENNGILSNVDVISVKFDYAEEMNRFSNDQTAYKRKIGEGNVIVLSYSLGLEPMISFSNKQYVATRLLELGAGENALRLLSGDIQKDDIYGSAIDIAKSANRMNRPNVWLYSFLLIVYIVLVGPGVYLILKKVNKREKLWISIPIISVCFVFLIYLTGFIYRVNKPIINTFSILTLDHGIKEEKVYVNLVCPRAEKYEIGLNNQYSKFYYDRYNYDYSIFGTDNLDGKEDYTLLKNKENLELLINSENVFSQRNFCVSKIESNDKGLVDDDLKCYTDGFEGTITNNTKYNLKNVVVSFEGYLYKVGDLKKGEVAKIDRNEVEQATGYTLSDYDSKRYYENMIFGKINQMMEMEIIESLNDNFNKGSIWAVIDGYHSNIVDKSNVKQGGMSILYQTFTKDYQDVSGAYYPSINPFIVETIGSYDKDLNYIYNDIEITYSFKDTPGIVELKNLSFNDQSNSNATVYMYNYETGHFDHIFEKKDTLNGEELKKYLVDDEMIVRYGLGNDSCVNIPNIIAKGAE